jgi:phosphatidylglycerophosphate synthase
MTAKPWDARLAFLLVQPFQHSWVTPNHFTTLRLLVGLAAVAAFATGHWPNLGALLMVLSNFLDHTDGELARLSGKGSRFGHFYDLACDALIHILLFVGIGIGLSANGVNDWAWLMGIVAGVAVALIFHLRNEIEQNHGKAAVKQPNLAGFEAEDVLYLLPVVTLLDGLWPFLIAASIGAPLALVIVIKEYLQFRSSQGL